jgi:hypothetical protein
MFEGGIRLGERSSSMTCRRHEGIQTMAKDADNVGDE